MKIPFILSILISVVLMQQILKLDTSYTSKLSANSTAYYSCYIPKQVQSTNFLIITATSDEYYSRPQIDISEFYDRPSSDNSDIKCVSYSINSCAKDNLVGDTWIYFSIYCLYDCNYDLILIIENAIQITLDENYFLYLNSSPSVLFCFKLSQIYYELMITVIQQNIFTPQPYYAYLGKNYVPNGQKFDKEARDFGFFSKMFKLQQDYQQLNSTYYFLIQAKQNQLFQIVPNAIQQNYANLLFINETNSDLTKTNKTYTVVFPKIQYADLFLQLHSIFGYGIMEIKYCLDDSFTYEDILGDILLFTITKQQRQTCKLNLKNENITQNMTITIIPYKNSQFGYLIQIEESSINIPIILNQKIFSQISPNITKHHNLQIPIRQSVNLSLIIQINKGDPIFELSNCFNNKPCVPSLLTELSTLYHYDPINCLKNCSIMLTASNSTVQSSYSFTFRMQGYHIKLFESGQDLNYILLNQYIYYNLTILSLVNITSITIKLFPISGDMRILTSQVIQSPKLKDLFEQNNTDVKTSWNGVIKYYQNLSKPIYIGVLGQLAGFYHIFVHTEKNQNVPSNYQLLLQNINNEYIINTNPLLLKIIPHNIPYYVKFSPLPVCISYGPTIPLKNTCMQLPLQLNEPIFINITGNRIGSIVSILVSNGNYQLSINKPVFIICNSNCSEFVTIKINKEIRIIHSGQGKIINKQTKQQISNGILNIACQTPQNKCQQILIAQLNQLGGNMIINIQQDNLSGISHLPKPTTLNKLPQQFYYKLPKNGPTVITVDSKGAVIDMYVNVQVLNQNYTNLLQIVYPTNKTYDLKQIGDPFRRIYMIQIEKQLLNTLGCFQDYIICIATISIYLNQNYQYSHQFINNGIIFISASSYTTKLQQNTPYRIHSNNQIEYFQYTSIQSKNLTLLLQPLSNCNPFLIYLNQSGVYPTLNKYTSLQYEKLTIKNTMQTIIGVVVEDQCLFDIILLPNTNNYRYIIAGFPQKIQLSPYSTEYFIFNSKNQLSIEIDSGVDIQMYANTFPYNNNPDSYLPNRTSYQFFSKIPPLIIHPNNSANYIVQIKNPFNWTVQTNILIKQQNQVIMLVHNLLYSSKSIENEATNYKYTSANSFIIYFTRQGGSFNITVSDPDNNSQFFEIISDDQILIENDRVGIFTQFMISVFGLHETKYTIQIIEVGSQARPNLLPGLPFSDIFTQYPQSNYYTFIGDPTSNGVLSLCFRYSQSYLNSLISNGQNISMAQPIFSFKFTGIGDKQKKVPKLLKSHEFYQGVTYQIEQQYGKYVFCFQNKNKQNLYKQYNIILSSRQISYLTTSIPLFVQTPSNLILQKYETFTTEPSTLIIQLYTCQGKAQLTGASKYSDILSGQTSEIMNHYINQYYYSGTVNISRGYYYIGVQTLISQTSYILNSYISPQMDKISLQNWQLQQINLKWYLKQKDLIVTVVPLKTLDKSYQSDQPHIYTLYISNNSASLKLRSKCQLFDKQNNLIVIKQSYNQQQSNPTVIFKIPIANLSNNFSMTCKVEVNMSNLYVSRTVPYYYNTTQQILISNLQTNNDNSKSEKAYIVVIITIILILLFIGIIYVMKKLKICWFSAKVAQPSELIEINTQKKQYEQKNNEPYGKFVDQTRI